MDADTGREYTIMFISMFIVIGIVFALFIVVLSLVIEHAFFILPIVGVLILVWYVWNLIGAYKEYKNVKK